jgi:hypothetical protein
MEKLLPQAIDLWHKIQANVDLVIDRNITTILGTK